MKPVVRLKPDRPALLPAIDLRDGKVVRLTQGDYDRQTTYAADPVDQAQLFESAGASWLHVVDLDGARSGEPANLETIRRVCGATGLHVEVGGGVRDERTVATLLDAGVQRVVLGTAALRDWGWFEGLLRDDVYRHRLVLGLDAKGGEPAVSGWEESTGLRATEVAERTRGWPLAGIVYTDIAVDGMLTGPNYAETEAVAGATDVPVIASGGVGTVEHLAAVRKLPVAGAIVGKALYDGVFTIGEALAAYEGAAVG
ncbi:MAG: 1-(5-phosphoribosyl)-5-[(5-phosphoribosylamino)methylideneamino]imidazole-4-carboxamide isomerase [Planctomycetota bacterium]